MSGDRDEKHRTWRRIYRDGQITTDGEAEDDTDEIDCAHGPLICARCGSTQIVTQQETR